MRGCARRWSAQESRWATWTMMIAAHALSIQAVLVTNDHVFRRVKQLKIEDWTQ
jgi:predicted nucleic acid-binding protein